MSRLAPVLGVLLLLLAACGGGGGDGPVTEPMPPPDQDDRILEASTRALIASIDAGIAALEASNACEANQAACEAAQDAADAFDRAGAAADAAEAATTAAEAERAAAVAEQAAMDAEEAVAFARLILTGDPFDPGQSGELPAVPFTLEPGTEIRLSEAVFLVCPSGGSQCHVEELTQDSEGQFQVHLTGVSDRPFYWNSGAGLFTGNLAPYADTTVRIAGSRNRHIVTCAQAAPCVVENLTFFEDRGRIEWFGSANVHVSADETGFFLLGDEEVTYPDGTKVLFSCPNGCGIDRIFIDSQGDYSYHYDDGWESPELEFASSSGRPGGVQIRHPQDIPPPVQTSHYVHLPAVLAKFPVDHWELQDVLGIPNGRT